MSELPFVLNDVIEAAETLLGLRNNSVKNQDPNEIYDKDRLKISSHIETEGTHHVVSSINMNNEITCANNADMELEECELYLHRNISKKFIDETSASLIYSNFEKKDVQWNGHGFAGGSAIYNSMVLKKKNWNVKTFCFGPPKITDKVYDGLEIYSFYFNDDFFKYFPSESPYLQVGTIVDMETLECTKNPNFIPKPETELKVHPIEDYITKLKSFA